MKPTSLLILILAFIFISCEYTNFADNEKQENKNYITIETPDEISDRVFEFAKLYEETETEYAWGGQDPVRAVKVDCSGLVIMCYKYAVVDTNYSLLFDDTTSAMIAEKYCKKTENPKRGDLILMGEKGTTVVSHIAIFDEEIDGNVYFIDSTEKPEANINGVTRRCYAKNDERFKFFGKMLLKKF